MLPLFICCSSHSENTSFLARLDEIDSYILYSDTKTAVEALKEVQDSAYSIYDKLGIYKRYLKLGEDDLAEKVLVQAHEAFSDSQILCAVHAKFLLDHDRLFEAAAMSYYLQGTKYSSIFSECMLKTMAAFNRPSVFKTEEMAAIYCGAWRGSGYSPWLRNAACILLEKGEYAAAASLYPGQALDEYDVLFWGCVLYDAGLFRESLECLLQSVNFVNRSLEIERLALESDDFYILEEPDSAEQIRSDVIEMTSSSYVDSVTAQKYLSKVYMNRALYASASDDTHLAFNCLYYLLEHFPDYTPALALYSRYALENRNQKAEDELSAMLRRFGLRTIEMEYRDSIPKAACDDAQARIRQAIETSPSSELYVLEQQFMNAVNRGENEYVTNSRLWSFLEGQLQEDGLYPEPVLEYVLSSCCGTPYESDGKKIFWNYIEVKYGPDFVLSEHLEELPLWVIQYGAYFAVMDQNVEESLALYESIARKFDEHIPAAAANNSAVVNSFVNLAVIYAGTSQDTKALEMLNKASWICSDAETKAEILFRMAELSHGLGDKRNALRQLHYCLELNADHRRARLFLKTIEK